MTTKLDYGIIDCDTHCYETRDAFTRYLPKEFQDRAITTVRGADGVEVILAGRRVATFNSEGGLGLDVAYRLACGSAGLCAFWTSSAQSDAHKSPRANMHV